MSRDAMNRFDEFAAQWDAKPSRVKMAKEMAEAIRKVVPLNEEMDICDFGAGTGLVSFQILPYVKSLLALDSSTGMLDQFNQKIETLNIANCRAETIDPQHPKLPENAFDLIISTMTFHHIEEPVETLKVLRASLKEEGMVTILDLDKEDGSFHEHGNEGIHHMGFDREEFLEHLGDAGFDRITIETACEVHRESTGLVYPIFIAHAVK